MVTTYHGLRFGKFWQLVGRHCSYQLPYCPGNMGELSQQEVVTIQIGHLGAWAHAFKNVFYLMSTMMAAMRPMLASVLVGTHWHVLVKSKM